MQILLIVSFEPQNKGAWLVWTGNPSLGYRRQASAGRRCPRRPCPRTSPTSGKEVSVQKFQQKINNKAVLVCPRLDPLSGRPTPYTIIILILGRPIKISSPSYSLSWKSSSSEVKWVTNISNLSPTDLVSYICHQHQFNPLMKNNLMSVTEFCS